MALGKAVFPKAFQLLEDAQGEVFRAAVFYHSGYQPMAEMFDAALALPGRHRAPQLIGFVGGKVGGHHGDLHGLFLEDGDRKTTRLHSSHSCASRMPSSACKHKY